MINPPSGKPKNLDLNHLRTLRAIAQCGSLSAAARALEVSQPTVSHSLKKLESYFDTTLALRDAQGVTLTQAGQTLLVHAEEMLNALDRAEQQISLLEHNLVGRFTLGCHESLGAYFLPGFMPRFLCDAPRIELNLRNDSSSAIRQAVIDRDVHFGLAVNPQPHPDLIMVQLYNDAVKLFIAAPSASIGEFAFAEISRARARILEGPLLYAEPVTQSQQIRNELAVSNTLPAREIPCGDMDLVKSLAIGGLGVAILPQRVALHHVAGALKCLHPDLPIIPDRIQLLYRADIHRTLAAMFLKDAIIKHGKGLPRLEALGG